jgi:hypothetical protein
LKVDLVIKDFPAGTEQAELTDHLVALGLAVVACRIVADGGTSRAIVLVERSTSPSGTAALVNGTLFRGQPLRATLASPRGWDRRM